MGCSSSAQTQVKESSRPPAQSPDAGGLQKRDNDSLTETSLKKRGGHLILKSQDELNNEGFDLPCYRYRQIYERYKIDAKDLVFGEQKAETEDVLCLDSPKYIAKIYTDDNLPITAENDTIPDQTKLGAMDEVELGSPGIKQSESLAEEVADILIPGMTNCALSTCQRVDPEGTEPQPVALEEKFNSSGLLPVSLLEAGEPLFVEPTGEDGEPQAVREAANILSQEIIEDNKSEPVESSQEDSPEPTTEENVNLVTEIVKELEVGEEELLTEDNNCLDANSQGETREKMETEMHCEIVSEGSETKEEETGEATAAATEIEVTNNEE